MKSYAYFLFLAICLGTNAELHAQPTPFDVCDSVIYYIQPGTWGDPTPDLVGVKDISGTMTTMLDCDLPKVYNPGNVNGIACNANDGFIYYQNRGVNGNSFLLRFGSNCDTTFITEFAGTDGYRANGCMDACDNYCRWYSTGEIVKYNIYSGVYDTLTTTLTGNGVDLMYNPFTCGWYVYRNPTGEVFELDASGTLVDTYATGVTYAGSIALTQDGSQFVLQAALTMYWYDISSGTLSSSMTIPENASGAPTADNGTFVCDNVMADITSLGDTIEIHTCQDSATIAFTNTSGGDQNWFVWDFGDGEYDSLNLNPTHTFEANSTYIVTYTASKFTCETCQMGPNNYDTIIVYIVPDTLQTTMSSTDPVCFEAYDGTGTVTTVTGGTPPYTYEWTTGGTGVTETGLPAGMHYVTVTDANSCSTLDSVMLVNPPDVIASASWTDVTCFGDTDGSIVITPTGGPFNYSWSSGETTASITGVGAGVYEVIVSDAAGCDTTITVEVGTPTEVALIPAADTLICIDGSATLNAIASGGNGGPYTYDWGTEGLGSPIITPSLDGCYDVIATDPLGCQSVIESMCVTIRDSLTLGVTGTDVCPGESSSLYSVYEGGDGDYSFSWTGPEGTLGSTAVTSTTPLASGEYCLTLSDGCETPDVQECVTVNVFELPAVALDEFEACRGTAIEFPAITPVGSNNFEWEFGDGATSKSDAPSHEYEYDGQYSVTVSFISADGCPVEQTFEDIVNILPGPVASFSYNPTDITVEDTEVDFRNESHDGITFSWDFGDGSPISNETDPTHIFPEIGDMSYPVTLWADNGICEDSITRLITIKEIIIFYVPNSFTPDGDQYNDEFKPIMTAGIDVYDYHFTVFNRWGEIIFESYDTDYGWDGSYSDQGLTRDNVYVWKIEFKETSSDKRHQQAGHVTLLK